MKKLLLIALLMLALVFTVVACNNDPATNETTAGETTVADVPADTTAEPDADTTAADVPADTTAEPDADTTAADVPADTTAEPATTEAPVDPADPVWIIDADGLAAMTNANAATVEKNEAGYASFTATGGDPWFLVTGSIGAMPEYLVLSYRTNTTQTGEFFIGNGAGPEGGKSFVYDYNANGEWNLLVFHLPTVASYMTDNTIGHIRFDFYTDGPEDGAFLDVEYIAFFNTAEYAEAYHAELHKLPTWDSEVGKTVVTHQSFDELRKVVGGAEAGGIFTPGQSAGWDKIAKCDYSVDALLYWGWVGLKGEIGQFGYKIDKGEYVFDDSFTVAAGQDVINAAAGGGADAASRFLINIPVADLIGEHTVTTVYKNASGFIVELNTFTINRSFQNWETDDEKNTVTFLGFNELNLFSNGTQIGGMFEGNGADWNKYGEIDFTVDALRYWGWAGVKGEMGEFGYSIDYGTCVFSPDFTVGTEQGVIDMILPSGADVATRLGIVIPVEGLAGEHTITTLYKNAAGDIVELHTFTINRTLSNWETDDEKNTVTFLGFNELNIFSNGTQIGGVFEGNGADWNKYGEIDITVDTLRYWGWAGVKGEMGEFGYSIDYGKCVFAPNFAFEAEQAVIDMILPSGADVATRLGIVIPVEGLVGEHTITTVYKNAAGDIVELHTFTINRSVKNWETDDEKNTVTFLGFNELNIFVDGNQTGGVFEGNGADWNKYGEINSDTDALRYWGWAGMKGEMGEFGYSIDYGTCVFSPDFTVGTEQGVIDMILPSGADVATRLGIVIPVEGLAGKHTITTLYKNAAGDIVELNTFTIVINEIPVETPEETPEA